MRSDAGFCQFIRQLGRVTPRNTCLGIVLAILGLPGASVAELMKMDVSHLSAPNADWNLAIDLEGTSVQKNDISPDGDNHVILVKDSVNGLTISVFIEKADHAGDAKECRKFYQDNASKAPDIWDDKKFYEKGEMAFFESGKKEHKGVPLNFHSLNVYLSNSGYWVDVHISKVGYSAKDKALFDRIVNSIRIEKPKVRNQSELLLYGMIAASAKNYKVATEAIEKGLEIEKGVINLDKSAWRLIVNNLGLSYLQLGDNKNALRVFQYGSKLDPNYPGILYNLACSYAELGQTEQAIASLDRAFQNKDSTLAGRSLPNPRKDSSFKSIKQNEKFLQLLKRYGVD